jgi:para-nitrobenzyl esterase
LLPVGSLPAISPLSTWAQQGSALVTQALIADGTAADATAAQAWIAAHTAAEVSAYLRGKSPDALLSIVRNQLTALGLSGSNPIPDGNVLPTDPIAAIRAGAYLKVPVLAGNTRDEAKLFPSLLTLSAGLGGVSGRLLDDATVFTIAFNYNPEGPATTTVAQWIPALYLPVDAPGTGFNAKTDLLNQYWFLALRNDVLGALKSQQANVWHYQFDWDRQPAPFNDIFGAAHTVDLPFLFGNFGPSLYASVWFDQANRPGRLALSAAMMKSVGSFARNGDPNDAALGVTWNPWPSQVLFDADANDKNIRAQ